MRVALCTTTIDTPWILRLYREYGKHVKIIVAGDQGPDQQALADFCTSISATYLTPLKQEVANWKCGPLIGWHSIQRRNIAFLEAVKWGADIIVSVDTDDLPTGPAHFSEIEARLTKPFNGIQLLAENGWVDPGSLIEPPTAHRGMPHRLNRFYARPALDQKVGVVASTVLGSCDLAAIDRVGGLIKRHSASELARNGVIVDPREAWTLFNSEAVAYLADLAPATMVLSAVGRYDDLFASMVAQRVMRERGYCVHLGPPIVWHEREDRNILKDVRNELYGMETILDFAAWLDAIQLQGHTILGDVRRIWNTSGILPELTHKAALAFADDYETALQAKAAA